jgi:hypothetical protein
VQIRPLKIPVGGLISREGGTVLAGHFEITAQELYNCLSHDYLVRDAKKRPPPLQLKRLFVPIDMSPAPSSGSSESHRDEGSDPPTSDRTHPDDSTSDPASDVSMSGSDSDKTGDSDMTGDSEVLAAGLAGEGIIPEQRTSGNATEQRSSYGRLLKKKQRG